MVDIISFTLELSLIIYLKIFLTWDYQIYSLYFIYNNQLLLTH